MSTSPSPPSKSSKPPVPECISIGQLYRAFELYPRYIGMEREAKKDTMPIFKLNAITEEKVTGKACDIPGEGHGSEPSHSG